MTRESEPVFRNDGWSKVTGAAMFADDFNFKHSLQAVPVYPDCVHGEILNIDITSAEKSPGVIKVFTWEDVPGSLTCGQLVQDLPVFVKDRIRCEGDVIALVVAETRIQALAAAELVRCEVRDLPGVFSISDALAKAAVVIHEDNPDNIVCHHKIRQGNAAGALEAAEIVLEHQFSTPLIEHAYMEPEAAVAVPDGNGALDLYGSFQQVFNTRYFISRYLDIPFADLTVHYHAVGGAFGGKDDTANLVGARVAMAALALGRPVKMVYDREWSMRESYKCPPYQLSYRLGATHDGILVGAEIKIYADSGAYTSTAPWYTWRSAVQCCGPYFVENVFADVYAVATNNPFTGAFRGFGSPQVHFAMEQMMDLMGEACNLSPVEIRRRNMVVQDGLTITRQKLDNHTVNMREVMERALTESNYAEKIDEISLGTPSDAGPNLYGIGFACAYRGVSYGAEARDYSNAVVSVQYDGSILVEASVMENGQGLQSAMILIVSDLLNVPVERIRYRAPTTSSLPDGGTTTASRGTLVGGGAIRDAVMNLKRILSKQLCEELDCSEEDIDFRNGRIVGLGNSLTWKEACDILYLKQIFPVGIGTFQAPEVTWDENTGTGNAYFSYTYGCQVAEVEISPDMKNIWVRKVTAVHDAGKIINPGLARGQVYGGIIQGMGGTLSEDLNLDLGRIANLNFNKYKIPRTVDIPEMEVHFIESDDSTTPSGAKGLGEPALELISAAIANAVANATGVRCFQHPINLNKVVEPWKI